MLINLNDLLCLEVYFLPFSMRNDSDCVVGSTQQYCGWTHLVYILMDWSCWNISLHIASGVSSRADSFEMYVLETSAFVWSWMEFHIWRSQSSAMATYIVKYINIEIWNDLYLHRRVCPYHQALIDGHISSPHASALLLAQRGLPHLVFLSKTDPFCVTASEGTLARP